VATGILTSTASFRREHLTRALTVRAEALS
jgi:hypothetical protein